MITSPTLRAELLEAFPFLTVGLVVAIILAPAWAQAQTPAPAPAVPEEPEIVVRAVRGKCKTHIADRPLSDGEFSARSKEWAALGTPVRVIAPHGASYKCLAKIAFKLNDKGVRLIHFIDRDEQQRAAGE